MLLLPIILLFLQVLAFGRSIPWSFLPFNLGMIVWLAITCLIVFWLAMPVAYPKIKDYDCLLSPLTLKFWFGLNILFSIFSFIHFKEYGYSFPFLNLGIILFGLICIREDRLYLSFILSILLLIASIIHFKINPARSDMLPVIQVGLDRWREGLDPYHSFFIADRTPDTMGYLPGTLFLNWPAWYLGIDLRWNSVFYRIIWMGMLLRAESLNPKKERLTLLHYLALSPYLNFRHELYFEGFWIIMVGYFLYPKLKSFSLALGVCTRQWFWILAPFLLFVEFSQNKKKWPRLLGKYILSFSFITLFFYLVLHKETSWMTFWDSIFWFQKEKGYQWDYGIGFARVIYWIGLEGMLQKLQALWCSAVLIVMIFKRPPAHQIWQWTLIAWFGFFLLNGHFWLYFWLSFVIFCAVAPYEVTES